MWGGDRTLWSTSKLAFESSHLFKKTIWVLQFRHFFLDFRPWYLRSNTSWNRSRGMISNKVESDPPRSLRSLVDPNNLTIIATNQGCLLNLSESVDLPLEPPTFEWLHSLTDEEKYTSERPNRSGSGSVRPNLEVRWGSAEPAKLKVRSTEPPPNQIAT